MTGRLEQAGAGLAALAMVAMLLVGAAAPATAAVSESTQTPEISVDVTKDVHRMSWGGDGEALRTFEGDNGNLRVLNGSINESVDNPVEFVPTDVNFSDAGAFPHDKDISALDAAEWTAGGQNSSKISATDVETAPGVDALNVASDGSMGSGDAAYVTFSNFSITSDEAKRYLQLALDVNSIDSGASVHVELVDEDGDYKRAVINTSRSSGEDLIGNATGEGLVYQRQLGKMSTMGSGDGTFNNAQKLRIGIQGGDADVSFSAINAEKMAKWTWGEERYQADDDDELETRTITEKKTGGAVSITSLSTLGASFDSAELHGVTFPLVQDATALPKEDTDVSFEKASDYPNFDSLTEQYYRFKLISAYDLSYADAQLTDTVELPGSRYTAVEVAEGTGDTAFSEISSWTSLTSSYDDQGASVTIDNTLQPGQSIVVHYRYLVTGSEKSQIEGSAVMGPIAGGGAGGGLVAFITSPLGAIASLLGGLWGIPKLLGGASKRFGS